MDPPRVEVEFRGSAPAGGGAGRWRVAWRVTNRGAEPVRLVAAWLPHTRFRCEGRDLSDLPALLAGAVAEVELDAAADDVPGTEVPAVFLILRFAWREQPWRLLARTTVTWDAARGPQMRLERVDLHPVGFAR